MPTSRAVRRYSYGLPSDRDKPAGAVDQSERQQPRQRPGVRREQQPAPGEPVGQVGGVPPTQEGDQDRGDRARAEQLRPPQPVQGRDLVGGGVPRGAGGDGPVQPVRGSEPHEKQDHGEKGADPGSADRGRGRHGADPRCATGPERPGRTASPLRKEAEPFPGARTCLPSLTWRPCATSCCRAVTRRPPCSTCCRRFRRGSTSSSSTTGRATTRPRWRSGVGPPSSTSRWPGTAPPCTPACWPRRASTSRSWTATARSTPRDLPALLDDVRSGRADLAVGRRRPVARGVWPWHARLGNNLVVVVAAPADRDDRPRHRADAGVPPHGAARAGRAGPPVRLPGRAAPEGHRGRVAALRARRRPTTRAPLGTRSKVSGSVRGTTRAARDFWRVLA